MNVKVRKTKKKKTKINQIKTQDLRQAAETHLSETVFPASGTSFCPLSKLELRLRTALADETSKGKFFGTGGGIGSMPGEWQSVPPESQARCRPVFGT